MSASRELEDSHLSKKQKTSCNLPQASRNLTPEQILEAGCILAASRGRRQLVCQVDIAPKVISALAISPKTVITSETVISCKAPITSETVIKKRRAAISKLSTYFNKENCYTQSPSDITLIFYISCVVEAPDIDVRHIDKPDKEVASYYNFYKPKLSELTPQEMRDNLSKILYNFLIVKYCDRQKLLDIAQVRARVLREASKEDDLLNKFIELMHLLIR